MTSELKESFSADIKALSNEIEGIKGEISKQNLNIKEVEQKTLETEKVVQGIEAGMKDNEERLLRMECHTTQLQLRLRGISEANEINKEVMVGIFAEYLEKEVSEIQPQIDMVYRINSGYALQKKLPRDVMVYFMSRNLKEEIFRKQFEKPLEVGGEKIKLRKELPRKVMTLLKD